MTRSLRLARFALPFALALGAAVPSFLGGTPAVTAQAPRPGVSISYAAIGGPAQGIDGRAYLPTTPAWVTVDTGARSCAGGRITDITARSRTGQVREMHIVVNATGTGTIALSQTGCPSATITATLDDGRVLTSTTGSVEVTAFGPASSPSLTATFTWGPMVDGRALPFRGTLFAPAPTPRPAH